VTSATTLDHRTKTPAVEVPTDLITLADAAALMGCVTLTVRRRISDGTLPGYRFGPRLLRVSRADVLALVQPVPAASAR
jgi:excisionase family DNA binding protein